MSALALENWSAEAGRLGVQRSLDPPGALPHIARVLDAGSPGNEYEPELEAETAIFSPASGDRHGWRWAERG